MVRPSLLLDEFVMILCCPASLALDVRWRLLDDERSLVLDIFRLALEAESSRCVYGFVLLLLRRQAPVLVALLFPGDHRTGPCCGSRAYENLPGKRLVGYSLL